MLEAWEAFKMRRKWFVDDFCQPVYEMFLAEAVALGRINAPRLLHGPPCAGGMVRRALDRPRAGRP